MSIKHLVTPETKQIMVQFDPDWGHLFLSDQGLGVWSRLWSWVGFIPVILVWIKRTSLKVQIKQATIGVKEITDIHVMYTVVSVTPLQEKQMATRGHCKVAGQNCFQLKSIDLLWAVALQNSPLSLVNVSYMITVFYVIWFTQQPTTGSFSYSAVRREPRPRQKVQSLADGTSYTGQSPAEAGCDPGSDPLTGRLELWTGSSCKKQRQWLQCLHMTVQS